jgi:hypothetical protein
MTANDVAHTGMAPSAIDPSVHFGAPPGTALCVLMKMLVDINLVERGIFYFYFMDT